MPRAMSGQTRFSTPGDKIIQRLRSSEGMGTQPDVDRPTPCNIASGPCSAPVISLFWTGERCFGVPQLGEITRYLSEFRVNKVGQMAILPCISPCYQGTGEQRQVRRSLPAQPPSQAFFVSLPRRSEHSARSLELRHQLAAALSQVT